MSIENIPKQTILTANNGLKSLDTEGELTNLFEFQTVKPKEVLEENNSARISLLEPHLLLSIQMYCSVSEYSQKRDGGWDFLNI